MSIETLTWWTGAGDKDLSQPWSRVVRQGEVIVRRGRRARAELSHRRHRQRSTSLSQPEAVLNCCGDVKLATNSILPGRFKFGLPSYHSAQVCDLRTSTLRKTLSHRKHGDSSPRSGGAPFLLFVAVALSCHRIQLTSPSFWPRDANYCQARTIVTMPTASEVLYYLVHFQQLRSIIQWYTEPPLLDLNRNL